MLRVALVGLGDAGKHHARALSRLHAEGALEWTAVCARDASRIDAFRAAHAVADSVATFRDLDMLLEARACDALILATPDGLHAEQVIASAAAGVHVLVEKPLALEGGSAERAVDAARRANVALAVGYHLRHHAGHRLVRARLRELVGEPRTMYLRWAWPDPATQGWRAKGQGARFWSMAALGTHCVDLALWFCEPPMEEIAATSLQTPALGIDRAAEVSFRVGDVLAHVSVSVEHRATSRLLITGTHGEVEALGTFGARGDGELLHRPPRGPATSLTFTPEDPYVAQLSDFAACTSQGFQNDPTRLSNVRLLDQIAKPATSTSRGDS